jgi:hypothetical protein
MVFLLHPHRPVCLCVRLHTHLCASLRSGGSTASCCSSAHSKLRSKKSHQRAAAAVDSELVNAMISPLRAAPLATVVSLDVAMTRFLLRNSKLHVRTHSCSRYICCLRSLCSDSNRFTQNSLRKFELLSRMATRVSRHRSASQATRSMRR